MPELGRFRQVIEPSPALSGTGIHNKTFEDKRFDVLVKFTKFFDCGIKFCDCGPFYQALKLGC